LTTFGIDRTTGSGGTGTSTTTLLADGSQPLTADWNAGSFDITALSFYASGTSPVFSLNRALNSQDNAVVFNEADGSARWRLTHVGTTDAFALQRYNASGVLQDSPISVSNSTGLVTATAVTVTGDLVFGGIVTGDTFIRRNAGNTAWEAKTPQQVADEIGPLYAEPLNKLRNPTMIIHQRGGSATLPSSVIFVADGWRAAGAGIAYTATQLTLSTRTPNNSTVGIRMKCTTGAAIAAGHYSLLQQLVEGFDVADCGFGTAAASPITLSFYIYSSKTGSLGGCVRNGANDRAYPFLVTINAANTWERKIVTIPGDTSGTWDTGNGTGIVVTLAPTCGTTYQGTANTWQAGALVAPSGLTQWNATNDEIIFADAQLVKGSNALPFVTPHFETDYNRCRRYCQIVTASDRFYASGASQYSSCIANFSPPMRATPTSVTELGGSTQSNNQAGYPQFNLSYTNQHGSTFVQFSAAGGDTYGYLYSGLFEAELT
jgi:hypothetical protein